MPHACAEMDAGLANGAANDDDEGFGGDLLPKKGAKAAADKAKAKKGAALEAVEDGGDMLQVRCRCLGQPAVGRSTWGAAACWYCARVPCSVLCLCAQQKVWRLAHTYC